jgi:hypothetical protein
VKANRSLEGIAGLGLVAQIGQTVWALAGPERLPDKIPMHFDAAGNPDGWGSWPMLILFPAIVVCIYLLMTVPVWFPSAFNNMNYPVQVTEQNRERLQSVALDMVTWMKAEMIWLFCWVQWAVIDVARHGVNKMVDTVVPAAIALIVGTIGWHIWAMVRAARKTPAK